MIRRQILASYSGIEVTQKNQLVSAVDGTDFFIEAEEYGKAMIGYWFLIFISLCEIPTELSERDLSSPFLMAKPTP